MAQIKVSQLTEDTAPTSDDFVLAVDNATHASKKVTMGNIVRKAGGLSPVATSGAYSDLSGKPTIPTVSGTNTGDQFLTLAGATLSISGASGNSVVVPSGGGGGIATGLTLVDPNGVSWSLAVDIYGSLITSTVVMTNTYGSSYGSAVYV